MCSFMNVGMGVEVAAVLVHMEMKVSAGGEFAQGVHTQPHQHHPDAKLERL